MKYHVVLPDNETCLFCGMNPAQIQRSIIEGCKGEIVDVERLNTWLRAEGVLEQDLAWARAGFLQLHRNPGINLTDGEDGFSVTSKLN